MFTVCPLPLLFGRFAACFRCVLQALSTRLRIQLFPLHPFLLTVLRLIGAVLKFIGAVLRLIGAVLRLIVLRYFQRFLAPRC